MCSSSQKICPEFFKVFLPDHCSDSLKIPDALLDHLYHKIPKNVYLRNCQGKLWPVEVAKTVDGLFFQQGWSRFVIDNALQIGQFLVFKYNLNNVMDIRVLGTNGCEKEQTPLSITTHAMVAQDQGMNNLALVEAGKEINAMDQVQSLAIKREPIGNKEIYLINEYGTQKPKRVMEEFIPTYPFFITEMRKRRRDVLNIPLYIREEYNLKFSDSIKLEDPQGRLWTGKIVSWKDGRVWVSDGWKQLCDWNAISEHDTLICEFMPSTNQTCQVIRVQILASG